MEDINSKEFKEASEKFQRFGPLAVTAADHQTIGSTPPSELLANPGETLEKLYSDDEIDEWFNETRRLIAEFSQPEKTGDFVESILKIKKAELEATERYLNHIGRR